MVSQGPTEGRAKAPETPEKKHSGSQQRPATHKAPQRTATQTALAQSSSESAPNRRGVNPKRASAWPRRGSPTNAEHIQLLVLFHFPLPPAPPHSQHPATPALPPAPPSTSS
eukprot:9188142-Pyramimonas_sp.AAC.1